MFNHNLTQADLYQLTIFNWSGGGGLSHAFDGKFCIALQGGNRYLSNDLTVENYASNCWYSPEVIADILKRLSNIKFCQCCGQIKGKCY